MPVGINLTIHILPISWVAVGDDTTRPRRQGQNNESYCIPSIKETAKGTYTVCNILRSCSLLQVCTYLSFGSECTHYLLYLMDGHMFS
jgi:hypothetical protein